MSVVPKKNSPRSDVRFNPDDTPIVSPWRAYNKFNKYDESFPIKAYELFSSGKTMAQVCRALGISLSTLKRWMFEIEEFAEACELGLTNFQAEIEDRLEGTLISEMDSDGEWKALPEVNTKLLETYLKAQIPETYGDSDKNKKKDDERVDGVSALYELLSGSDKASISVTKDNQSISIEKNTSQTMKIVNNGESKL